MSVLIALLFAGCAALAVYSMIISLRDYGTQVRYLFNTDFSDNSSVIATYAVWPTRLRFSADQITGVPQVLFRRRMRPFVRTLNWRPAEKGAPRVTRYLRYATAPDRVIVLA